MLLPRLGIVRKSIQLQGCWLFAIVSKKDLARRLTTETHPVSVGDLERLINDATKYRVFLNKKSREIQEPKPELQRLHKRIHVLLSRVAVPDYLHSAVKGVSYLTNARAHSGSAPALKLDVRKFFQSVPKWAVFDFFYRVMHCRKDVAGLLADLLTIASHLPTGSSASPIMSYYAFRDMFDELYALAKSKNLKMTCYVDDITFSGTAATTTVLNEARSIISKHGLKSHKTRQFSGSTPKVITGVCIAPNEVRVPNKLHLKISQGFKALRSAETTEEKARAAASLLGRLGAARQIDPRFGARATTLRSQLRANSEER